MSFFSGLINTVKDVGSAIGSFGELGASFMSSLGQQSANQANRDIANTQMQFQERMSNTSYQRAVNDLTQAGLNPMLAYSNGGASTPAGASAVMQNALEPGVSSGLKAAMNKAQIDNMVEQNEKLKAETATAKQMPYLLTEQEARERSQAYLNNQLLRESEARAANYNISTALQGLQIPRATNEAVAQESWWMKHVSPYLPDVLKSTSSAAGAAKVLK